MSRKLWLTWETQRRNRELAEAFQCELVISDHSARARVLRYLLSFFDTIRALVRVRPTLVIAQCPSLLLVALLAFLKPLFGFRLVIDGHNALFDYLQSERALLLALARFGAKRADRIIVSNGALIEDVALAGSSAVILPDRLPTISPVAARPALLDGVEGNIVTCICSFAPDEPLEPLLEAATTLPPNSTFFFTGKRERAGGLLRYESPRIRFTGFLSDADYLALLSHSTLLIDVTIRPNCLLCGAYEALALEVPILLSDTPALRDAFSSVAFFSPNTAAGFATALSAILNEKPLSGMNIHQGKAEFETVWNSLFLEARSALEELT